MQRHERNIGHTRMPGETGVEFSGLEHYRRSFVISSGQEGVVSITVGCHIVSLTAEEAAVLGAELITASESA
jgi:hypothetical protein